MAVGIHKLIAAIVPDIYCKQTTKEEKEKLKEVKAIAKEKGYIAAAEKAEVVDAAYYDLVKELSAPTPFQLNALKNPIEKHILTYDSFSQALEPLYFWFMDYVGKEFKNADKVIDNFVTAPGSAQFSEMGQRGTKMQEEAMKMIGLINQIIKAILNIIYDLKEFKLTLEPYDELKSKDQAKITAAYLGLKQKWMDVVDVKRGNASINGMAQQLDFVTLRDAFMMIDSLKRIDELDLNDRVKRILKIKFSDFDRWLTQSESELKKRYDIEKIYLKSQVNSVKLYARWMKPYLRAAKLLEQRATPTIALVNSFNTTLLELSIIAEGKFKPEAFVWNNDLPKSFLTITKKKYMPITIIEFKFISSPERIGQGGYGFRGKVVIEFTSYALTDAELKVLKAELEKDDLGDLISMTEGVAAESLDRLQLDIDEFLGDKEEKKEAKKKEESQESNPFTALFSFLKKKDEEKKEDNLPNDNEPEKVWRDRAIIKARVDCKKAYNEFKGSINMPSI